MADKPYTSRQLADQIHEDMLRLIQVPEPTSGDVNRSPLATVLGELGSKLFRYAASLQGKKPDVLADVLCGIGCCLAGMGEGVAQADCQMFAKELLRSLRQEVPEGLRRVEAGEDPYSVIDDLSPDIEPENN